MAHELFISVDIEAAGPVPGIYSMLALGACVVGDTRECFHSMFRPVSQASVPEAMNVVGKTLAEFNRDGVDPPKAIGEFAAWVKRVSGRKQPVFVGFNAAFDWSFVNWYFANYGLDNPFGVGALDIKAFYMGMSGCAWEDTRSSRLPEKYRAKLPHAHDALRDAIEQAEVFERMACDAGVDLGLK